MNKSTYGTQQWLEKISKHELPALAATVRLLEKIAQDETSSLAILGQSVLHDHGLTSRILRVVNSVNYNRSNNQITTVSRAAVILGYDQLKRICITARMIDSLLNNKNISEAVYQRVLMLMARSFHAARLAKMMLKGYAEDTQEEVYIAALLHNLGEVAFWTMGGQITEQLDELLTQSSEPSGDVVYQLLGTRFEQLSVGLASNWNMGSMLVKSLGDPNTRTPELRSIHLAHQFSQAMVEEDDAARKKSLKGIAEQMKLPLPEVQRMVIKCTDETLQLARSYGAGVLEPYLDHGSKQTSDAVEEEQAPAQSKQSLQLQLLRELTLVATETPDLNLVIHTAMEGIQRGIGLERVMVLMVNPSYDYLLPRFVTSESPEQDKQDFKLSLVGAETIFSTAYKERKPIWYKGPQHQRWASLINNQIRRITKGQAFFLAPIVIEGRCIALIYADSIADQAKLSQEDFDMFTHFAQQTDLCLSVVLRLNR
ncbi:HDOD domain-containing protein [Agarivorans sp.]|uniref:HDOD domain-containing protein n=1 Tax=Agarivorans sp. TaxID=1872412 RepID=UPI003CFE8E6A